MPNRRNYQDRQRSNEPYNARSEYGRRRHSSSYGASEQGRGEDYYENDRSRYESGQPGNFAGSDFGRGYDPGNYQETYGGHGTYEGMYNSPYSAGDMTDRESDFQNRGRNYENRSASGGRGDGGYGRSYPGRTGSASGSYGPSYPTRGSYPESERGYYGDSPRNYEEDRGWWDKATDEVSSWMGDEEAARRREMDALRHGQYRGHGPRNYTRSDERIKEDINDRLTDHAYLDASDIDVEVNDGEVVLSGKVINRYAKRMAEDIAENISGVKNVENRLRAGNRASWIAGAGDINTAGNRTTFTDAAEEKTPHTKSMSKNA